ncbi:GNAT family N-acetyltransferase [Fictibacillus sp. KIGAM418]|uniref:GNAT family N-acetyltransferase n=1 Tax=Fictibacillus marinisediminis TaxID=2878389 RepID=A0A9X2BED6_9BACL|nr:GNAT family protein [Fictibacillus marinisediminis]MCK6255987.1 GNAT family N-acetyltransferase [Fictibacillus marinisediminis]
MEEIYSAFPQLETKRFILRNIEEEDADDLHEVYSDPEVVKFWGTAPFTSIEQTKSLICDFQKGYRDQMTIRWGIAEREENRLIGTCGYHNWAKKKFRTEIGYEIRKSNWRKGVMKEVLSAILPFAFQHMKLNRIGALIHPDNHGSAMLVSKLGFHEEGCLRDYQCVDGEFQDLVMYSLLKKDILTQI